MMKGKECVVALVSLKGALERLCRAVAVVFKKGLVGKHRIIPEKMCQGLDWGTK